MRESPRQRGLDEVARLASRADDLTCLWQATTEVLSDVGPFYWTPHFYTMDPVSLLVTSHFHYGLAEFPAEWLEQEYDGQDVHALIDVVLSATRCVDAARPHGREPVADSPMAAEHPTGWGPGDDRPVADQVADLGRHRALP